MAESVIELQRRLHEEREALEVAASELMFKIDTKDNSMGRKDTVLAETKVKYFLDGINERSSQLVELYADEGKERQTEMVALGGPNEFAEFYQRLAAVTKEYRATPGLIIKPADITHSQEPDGYVNGKPLVVFSDEEQHGDCLDLNEHFKEFLNLDMFEKTDYLDYLTKFDQFSHAPRQKKFNQKYTSYLTHLETYLSDFYTRALPLKNLAEERERIQSEFDAKWKDGTCEGWEYTGESAGSDLYCKPCGKTFANQNVFNNHLTGKKHKKAAQATVAAENEGADQVVPSQSKEKTIAMTEFSIQELAKLLDDRRKETCTSVERKQARTAEELEEDQDDFDADSDGDNDDDEDKAIYNPKNLPLGWDGKPIPYWLYKLHGLNINYKCEICGGASYRGPKAFHRHFQEAKHAHGMRMLGIPNTSHFINVTTKADAEALFKKLQNEKKEKEFAADNDEEYEDSLGNVISKRIYMDLKANGLL